MANKPYSRFITPTKKPQLVVDQRLSVIILGALPSHKMRSQGPKSLFKLTTGETLLQKQVCDIRLVAPDSDIILTVGFGADKILRQCPNSIRIVENQLFETTNTFEELRLALNNVVTENVLIIHGEMMFNTEAIDRIIHTGMSSVIVDSKKNMPEDDIGVTVVNGKATILAHDVSPKWGYIAFLLGKELKLFKTICSDRDKNKLYMFEGLNYVLERDGVIQAIEVQHAGLNKMDAPRN